MSMPNTNNGTLLLVHETRRMTRNWESILEPYFRVIAVESVPFRTSSISPDTIDLILADVVPLKTAHVCRMLGSIDELDGIPVLVTASSEEEALKGLSAGALDIISVECSDSVVIQRLKNFMDYKRGHDAVRFAADKAQSDLEELRCFTEMAAHDLKSPTTAVQGFVKLMRKTLAGHDVPERADKILEHMWNAAGTIMEFLTDLSQVLVPNRLDLHRQPVDLREAVHEVLRQNAPLLEEKRITVRASVGEGDVRIMGDKRRLVQVIDNLVVNSIRHMGSKPDGAISVECTEARDLVTVCVSDNGVGIPAEHRERIFDRFYRVPNRDGSSGTGLGLSIARSIIEGHHGKIWLESAPNRGASFCFALPRSLPELDSTAHNTSPPQ
jgi:signal transduction histidine kinase